MKKVLMLLWKVVLVSLKGLRQLQDTKNEVRKENNLPPLPEDTHEVCRHMRASSPPASAADLIDQQMPRRGLRSGAKRVGIEYLMSFNVQVALHLMNKIVIYVRLLQDINESVINEWSFTYTHEL